LALFRIVFVKPKILCVDCDGTLIATDLLVEAILKFHLQVADRIIVILVRFFQGRNILKSRIFKLIF